LGCNILLALGSVAAISYMLNRYYATLSAAAAKLPEPA
jgi:hypothetical protein